MPEPKIAESLQKATKNDLIHFDQTGRARSPARYRALSIAFFGLMGGLFTAEALLCYLLYLQVPSIGIAMGLVCALAFVWCAWALANVFSLKRGVELLALEQVDEAARVFEAVARAPLIGPVHRARARQNLSVCRAIEGRHDEALSLVQLALASSFWRRTKVRAQLGRYHEVICLVNVGRAADAKSKLVAIGEIPDGEILRLRHWDAELYVALALGRTVLREDELQKRARTALEITIAASTLGLLAWAFDQRGDDEMAAHLLREALDRHPGRFLSGPMPLLEAWMRERAETLAALPA